jgi:hypothetical protein
MSALQTRFTPVSALGDLPSLSAITFAPARLALAQLLVAFSFVWPFFNYDVVDPGNTTEINFLPVFLAALLLPEVTLREKRSLMLAMPVFAVALLWANPAAPLRLAMGIVPLHFVLNLAHRLRAQGRSLLPPGLAYRVLQIFVAFCILQIVQCYLFPVIPEWLTAALTQILPRYSGMPYDEYGVRGVQGWASEPSGAAVTCLAFSMVAIMERPDRRWRVLAIYSVLVLVNRSVYAWILAILLGISCLAAAKRKFKSYLVLAPMSVAAILYIVLSNRIGELRDNILVSGVSGVDNRDLTRLVQIFSPLQQFPLIYKPVILKFEGLFMTMEPMGLIPLVIGYGSVFGLIWLVYMMRRNWPSAKVPQRPMALLAAFVLLMMTAPDLIPSVVALAVCLVPMAAQSASGKPSSSRVELFRIGGAP